MHGDHTRAHELSVPVASSLLMLLPHDALKAPAADTVKYAHVVVRFELDLVAVEPLTVIKGWHISSRLQWRLASGFLDRLGTDQTPTAPVLRIQISPAALTVRLDAAAVMIALGLSASFLHFYRFYAYRKLRPQVCYMVKLEATMVWETLQQICQPVQPVVCDCIQSHPHAQK